MLPYLLPAMHSDEIDAGATYHSVSVGERPWPAQAHMTSGSLAASHAEIHSGPVQKGQLCLLHLGEKPVISESKFKKLFGLAAKLLKAGL